MGTRMWVALTSLESIAAAHESLLAAFDVDGERLRQDLQTLVTELAEHGLLDIHGH